MTQKTRRGQTALAMILLLEPDIHEGAPNFTHES